MVFFREFLNPGLCFHRFADENVREVNVISLDLSQKIILYLRINIFSFYCVEKFLLCEKCKDKSLCLSIFFHLVKESFFLSIKTVGVEISFRNNYIMSC